MIRRPYDFLEKAFAVLVVHRDSDVRQRLATHICAFPLFTCIEAASTAEAVSMLLSSGPVHCVIQDFGMDDVRGDEYCLVQRFGARIPFIMYSHGRDVHKGCEAIHRGARDALDSVQHPPGCRELLFALCREAAIGVLLPGPHDCLSDTLLESFSALVCGVPQSVEAWSAAVHCCPRQLQRVWKDACDRHPHDVPTVICGRSYG